MFKISLRALDRRGAVTFRQLASPRGLQQARPGPRQEQVSHSNELGEGNVMNFGDVKMSVLIYHLSELLRKLSSSTLKNTGGSGGSKKLRVSKENKTFEFKDLTTFRVDFCECNS